MTAYTVSQDIRSLLQSVYMRELKSIGVTIVTFY